MIHDFYTWLLTLEPAMQLAAALVVIAGVAAFLVMFLRTPPEPRRVRWVVAVCAGFLASLVVLAVINIVRLVMG
jgi:hypothetical protein